MVKSNALTTQSTFQVFTHSHTLSYTDGSGFHARCRYSAFLKQLFYDQPFTHTHAPVEQPLEAI